MRTRIIIEVNDLKQYDHDDFLDIIQEISKDLSKDFECEVTSMEIFSSYSPYEIDENLRRDKVNEQIENSRDKSFR